MKISLLTFLGLLFIMACKNPIVPNQEHENKISKDSIYNTQIIKLDILNSKDRLDLLNSTISEIEKENGFTQEPYYWIFKVYKAINIRKRDSIEFYLSQIDTINITADIYALKEYFNLSERTKAGYFSAAEEMEEIIKERDKVAKSNSVFVYLMDDLLAMGFYNNSEPDNSLIYVKEYNKHHPLSDHDVIKQRYYDIRFMISQMLENKSDMKLYLDSCRRLAISLNDSLAIMRTYDYEGQLNSHNGRPEEAVKNFRKFYNYLKFKNKLQFYVFNNFSKAFLENKQPDSTLKYLKLSEEWGKNKNKQHNTRISELDMYSLAYAMKGDYKNAYLNKTQQHDHFLKTVLKLQKDKIAELNTIYETQKKDQDIQILKATNDLSQKVLIQQRWIFFILFVFLIFVLAFTYKIYKEKLLKAKHDQLLLENKQYLLEQKNRQNQLNPHFIFNSIANLQGLIGTDKKIEANKYLMALTKLIRDILELNRQDFITLDQEVRSLNNYILLQQMRFNKSFDYAIDTADLDKEDVLIPPMLIQPFVENAIEYGMKNIDYKGLLEIEFFQQDNYLVVIITDNGLGLQHQQNKEFNKESLSQVITKERLELLYGTDTVKATLKVFPNYLPSGKGYKVEIYLPIKHKFN